MTHSVLVFCAHSDDQAFGAGGYIAKLAAEKQKVKTIICSFGEQSHPHLIQRDIGKTRVEESERADKILGGHGVEFLGLKEGSFEKDYEKIHAHVLQEIVKFNPDRILTHSSDDPHPDHRAVHRIVLQIHDTLKRKPEVYSFDVWNLFNLKKRRNPKLVIDITQTFKKKIDALHAFKSQVTSLALLLWSVYTKALLWGFRRGCRYAEVYYRIR